MSVRFSCAAATLLPLHGTGNSDDGAAGQTGDHAPHHCTNSGDDDRGELTRHVNYVYIEIWGDARIDAPFPNVSLSVPNRERFLLTRRLQPRGNHGKGGPSLATLRRRVSWRAERWNRTSEGIRV